MNKCSKCGAEFEGKFCPECGTRFDPIKICPECGAECNDKARFCSHCGYNFEQSAMAQQHKNQEVIKSESPKNIKKNEDSKSQKEDENLKIIQLYGKILLYVPLVLCNLFWLLSFIFMSQDMASLGISWGNIYYNIYDYTYRSYSITCVVLTSLCVLLGFVYSDMVTKKRNRLKCQMVGGAQAVIIFIYMIVVCVLYDNLRNEGFDVGAAVKLLISLCVIFFVSIGFCLFWDVKMMMSNEKYMQTIKQFTATANPIKKHLFETNDKNKENKSVIIVNDTMTGIKKKMPKFMIAVVIIAIIISISLWALIVTIIKDHPIDIDVASVGNFLVSKVSKIDYNDTWDSIRSNFGKPDETEGGWIYYGKYFKNLHDKQKRLEELWESEGSTKEYFDNIEKGAIAQMILDDLEEKIIDNRLYIAFEDGHVNYVGLDKHYNVKNEPWDKTVSKVSVGQGNTVKLSELYENNAIVHIRYTDRSYRLTVLPKNAESFNLVKENTNSIPTSGILRFSDSYGSYNAEVKFVDSDDFEVPASWTYDSGTLSFDNEEVAAINRMLDIDVVCYDMVQKIRLNVSVLPDLESIIYNPYFIESVENESNNFYIEYGILFDKDKQKILYIPAGNINLPFTTWYKNQENGALYIDNVFYGYKGVSGTKNRLIIADGTTEIAPNALNSLYKNLQSGFSDIVIPKSVVKIGCNAFAYSRDLANVYYEGTFDDWCKINFVSASSNPMAWAEHLYFHDDTDGYTELTEIIIPEGVTQIGDFQFYGMENVSSVSLPNSLQEIGVNAFYGISGYNENGLVYLGNKNNPYLLLLRAEGDETESMTELTVSNKTRFIVSLQGLANLERLILPDSVIYLGPSALEGLKALRSVTLSANISAIEYSTFSECGALEEVVLPSDSKLSSIDIQAFYNCTSLQSISLPKNLRVIMFNAFSGCKNLNDVTVGCPDGWTFNGIDLNMEDPSSNARLLMKTYVNCTLMRK